jgi:hypothetical protein
VAHRFNLDLTPLDPLPMSNLEYRITDAYPVSDTQFWVINYFFPGDTKLKPADDALTALYGQGATHAQYTTVERLVLMQVDSVGKIVPADQPPVLLQLLNDDDSRNWEGLVVLDDLGFLLATDKYPETLFAFVPFP